MSHCRLIHAWNLKALRRELEMWKRLVHMNILPLLGIARGFSPSISMVSPWCENGSLAAYLQKHEGITLFDRLRLVSLLDNAPTYFTDCLIISSKMLLLVSTIVCIRCIRCLHLTHI
jgi:serine/threonine protein kinase